MIDVNYICAPYSKEEIITRLLNRRRIVDKGYITPCWLYTKYLKPEGYGEIRLGSRQYSKLWLVHVLSFILFRTIEYNEKLWVLHKCDVSTCFNPDHLYQGDNSTNMKDMWARGRRKRRDCVNNLTQNSMGTA